MTKRTEKKITLTRETVRLLTDDEAKSAVGGGISQQTCNQVCGFSGPTVCVSALCLNTATCR